MIKEDLTLGQFVFNLKKKYKGKAFVKPGYLKLKKNNFFRCVTFSIDEDSLLVMNDYANEIIEKELAQEIFEALYKNQELVGKVQPRARDYLERVIVSEETATDVFGNKGVVTIRYEILEIMKDENDMFQVRLKNLTTQKEVLYHSSFKEEEEFIAKIKELLEYKK